MRTDLNKIERVEEYLIGALSADDRTTFEKSMAVDTELQALFNVQQDLMTAIKRRGLMAEIQQVGQSQSFFGENSRWLFGGGALLLIVAFMTYMSPTKDNAPFENAEQFEETNVEPPVSNTIVPLSVKEEPLPLKRKKLMKKHKKEKIVPVSIEKEEFIEKKPEVEELPEIEIDSLETVPEEEIIEDEENSKQIPQKEASVKRKKNNRADENVRTIFNWSGKKDR